MRDADRGTGQAQVGGWCWGAAVSSIKRLLAFHAVARPVNRSINSRRVCRARAFIMAIASASVRASHRLASHPDRLLHAQTIASEKVRALEPVRDPHPETRHESTGDDDANRSPPRHLHACTVA